jgi:hypothetical protein
MDCKYAVVQSSGAHNFYWVSIVHSILPSTLPWVVECYRGKRTQQKRLDGDSVQDLSLNLHQGGEVDSRLRINQPHRQAPVGRRGYDGKAKNGGRKVFHIAKPRRWGIRRGDGGSAVYLWSALTYILHWCKNQTRIYIGLALYRWGFRFTLYIAGANCPLKEIYIYWLIVYLLTIFRLVLKDLF